MHHFVRIISLASDRDERKRLMHFLLTNTWPCSPIDPSAETSMIVEYPGARVSIVDYDIENAGMITSAEILFIDVSNPTSRLWACELGTDTNAKIWAVHDAQLRERIYSGRTLAFIFARRANLANYVKDKFKITDMPVKCSLMSEYVRSCDANAPTTPRADESSMQVEQPSSKKSSSDLYGQWLLDNPDTAHKWLEDKRKLECLEYTPAHYLAAHGIIDVLKAARVDTDINLSIAAATKGQLDVIKWLKETAGNVDETGVCEVAAARGHLHILKFMHEWSKFEGHNFITSTHLVEAAANGHFHVVEWAHKHWYLANQHCRVGIFRAAVRGGRVKIVQFLRGNCTMNTFARADVEAAALAGHLEMVQLAAVHDPKSVFPMSIVAAGAPDHVIEWIKMIYSM